MGFMTLQDFQDELRQVGGGAGLGFDRLKRFVNAGYYEVAGARDFRQLRSSTTLAMVDGQASYSLPSDLLNVKSVNNKDNPRQLIEWGLDHLQRFDVTDEGEPKYFAYDATHLWVYPAPNSDYAGDDVLLRYSREPQVLANLGDTTVLPGTYDMAIVSFAKYYMLENLAESIRARNWWLRGQGLMNSRQDARAGHSRVAVGARVAFDEDDLAGT